MVIFKSKVLDSYYFSLDQLNSGELCCCHVGVSDSNAYRGQEGNIHERSKVGVRKTTGRGRDCGVL